MLPMGIDFIWAIIKGQVVCAAPIHKPSFILVGSCNVRFWTLELGGPRFGSCLYSSETSFCFLSYNNEDKHLSQRTVGRTRDNVPGLAPGVADFFPLHLYWCRCCAGKDVSLLPKPLLLRA